MSQEPKEPAYIRRAAEAEKEQRRRSMTAAWQVVVNFIGHQQHAAKRAGRRQRLLDRRLWRLSVANVTAIWIAALAAGLAIVVSKCISDQQIAANQKSSDQQINALRMQLDEMRAQTSATKEQTLYAERAWVGARYFAIKEPLFYNVNGANFTIAFQVANVGHAPATSIFPTAFITSSGLSDYGFQAGPAHDYLASLKARRCPVSNGSSLLPGDAFGTSVTVTVRQDELNVLADTFKAVGTAVLGPMVLVVITYCTEFDDLVHKTTYNLQIVRHLSDAGRRQEVGRNRSDMAFFADEGDVPAARMQIHLSLLGEAIAD